MKLFGNKKKKDISTKTSTEPTVSTRAEPPEAGDRAGPRVPENTVAPVKGKPSVKKKSPLLAALLGFLIPGLGLIYTGLVLHGIVVFLTAGLIVPYWYGIFSASSTASKINRGEPYGSKLGLFISILSGAALIVMVSLVIIPVVVPMIAARNALKELARNKPLVVTNEIKAEKDAVPSQEEKAGAVQKPAEEANEPKEKPVPEPEGVFEGGGEVPIYPGTEMLGTKMRDNYIGHKFAVKFPLKNVVKFYKTRLMETGYKLFSSDYKEGAEKTSLSFSRGSVECKIDLNKGENGSTSGLISIIQ